ncbi:MAG: pro-sigmaK processing inhibitor BofA family protein [Oscillospiraceae bacterium]|jgi:hypothetical protein|nr:pro-sigmaK processing inhibitor BofA family protein [Oscillospiraceae bacterium]
MNTQLKALLCAVAGGGALAVLAALLRSRRLIRYLLLGVLSGVAALYAVNALGMMTGIHLAVNWLTLGVSATAGPPGVVGLLVIDTLLR